MFFPPEKGTMKKRSMYSLSALIMPSVFLISLIMAGCVSQHANIPKDEIRGRANRAFDELRAEEAQNNALPRETKRADKKGPSHTETKEGVQATRGKRPDWIDGESARYPSSKYLIGVGYGSDRHSAEDNARSEIAKIFYSKVDSQTRIYQEYVQTKSKDKSAYTEFLDIEQISRVSTQKVLSGVRISQIYEETKPDPIFYALAVLERDRSAAILQQKIQQLDQGIQSLLADATREQDTLVKIRHLKQSLRSHILREAYDAELRIVNQSGDGITPPIHFTEIKRRLEAILLRDYLFGVLIKGSRAEEIREAVVQGLNQQGFSVCEDLSRTHVVVRATIDIKPLNRGTSEWKYVEWRAHLDLVDRRNDVVIGSVNETGKEGHTSLYQAEDRAVRNIRKALGVSIAREMTRYIFSF